MMQINTSTNEGEAFSSDVEKMQLQEMVQDYLNNQQVTKDIRNIVHTKGKRFNINLDNLRQFNPRLATFVIKHPIDAIKMFEDQLNTTVRGMSEDGGKQMNEKMQANTDTNFPTKIQPLYVNFEGNLGQNYVTPRGL